MVQAPVTAAAIAAAGNTTTTTSTAAAKERCENFYFVGTNNYYLMVWPCTLGARALARQSLHGGQGESLLPPRAYIFQWHMACS